MCMEHLNSYGVGRAVLNDAFAFTKEAVENGVHLLYCINRVGSNNMN